MFKLITFDINGTLLRLKQPIGIMYSEAGKLFGINSIKPECVDITFKKEWKKMCSNHPNFGVGGIGWECWWQKLVKVCVTSASKKTICVGDLNALCNHLIQFYATKNAWTLQKGALELLRSLKSQDVVMGVISNSDPRLHQILSEFNLDSYFAFILTSYETYFCKPDVCIFKIAERIYQEKTGTRLNAMEALHVGNSVEYDVNGARNVGWVAALISEDANQHIKLLSKEHIYPFSDLCDFKAFIT